MTVDPADKARRDLMKDRMKNHVETKTNYSNNASAIAGPSKPFEAQASASREKKTSQTTNYLGELSRKNKLIGRKSSKMISHKSKATEYRQF